MTQLDDIRADLLRLPSEDLLPALRRDQDLTIADIDDVGVLSSTSAVARGRLTDGRRLLIPAILSQGHWRRAEAADAMSMSALGSGEPFAITRIAEVPHLDPLQERALAVDMSNDVRVIDNALVAKWQLFAEPGSLAGPTVVEHLVAAGFHDMPPPIAHMAWKGDLVVSFAGYLDGAQDGWDWMVGDVVDHLTGDTAPPSWPATLGHLTGLMHAAAATPTQVIPSPRSTASLTFLAEHYERLLAAAGGLDREMQEALSPWLPRFEGACAFLAAAQAIEVQPIHGDLHAGQFLRHSSGIVVNDFDGNPLLPSQERGLPGPTAYDLAGVLRTLDHVAIVAARRADTSGSLTAARAWAHDARERALQAYAAVEGVPQLDAGVLAALESLSPLHEAVYAATYLPRWRYVPLAVLSGGW